MIKKLVILNFPKELLKEPIIHTLGQEFCLVTNIQLAEITEDMGWMKVELEGETKQIEDGIAWVISRGVRVDPISES